MGIDAHIVDNEVIFQPRDRMTGLIEALHESMRASHHRRFIVDMRDVSVLDSDGLTEIVRTYSYVTRQGGTLKLVNLPARIQELLSIAELSFLCSNGEEDDQAGVGIRLKPRRPLDESAVSLPLSTPDPESDEPGKC